MFRPFANCFTSRRPPRSTTAYRLPAVRLLTKSVPLSPHAIARALSIPLAHSSALNPAGTLMVLTGISLAAFGAGGWAWGASCELDISGDRPCCHGGACWARTRPGTARTRTRMLRSTAFMACPLEVPVARNLIRCSLRVNRASARGGGPRHPVLEGRLARRGRARARSVDQPVVGRKGTDGIGGVRAPRQLKGLTAAAAEVHRPAVAAPAGLGHPGLAPEGVEAGPLLPDLRERAILHVVESEARKRVSGVTRQREAIGADEQEAPAPAVHARRG